MKFIFDLTSQELKPVAEGVLDKTANNIDGWLWDHSVGAATGWVADKIVYVVQLLNQYSPEIITIGVVACALGMMFGPLLSNDHRWFGRLVAVLIFGVIWRLLLI